MVTGNCTDTSAAVVTTVVAVVATHWHFDHAFGLAGFAGVPTFAHETVPSWLAHPGAREVAENLGVAFDSLAAPTQTFALARVVDLGGPRVELVHFGRGHTDGDVVAIVPDSGVIFAGDLLRLYLDKMVEYGAPRVSFEDALFNVRQQLMTARASCPARKSASWPRRTPRVRCSLRRPPPAPPPPP